MKHLFHIWSTYLHIGVISKDMNLQPYFFFLFFSMNPQTLTWANWFELPILNTNITEAQKEVFITLSDHEPVISTIYVKKFSKTWPYI